MNLEEKVMYLYEDILGPEKERKFILLLKYVIVDREFDFNKIKNEIGISKSFIESRVDNDELMLKYLTEDELKIFRLKIDNILQRNQKLIKLINLVLTKNETDIDKIVKTIPISIDTLNKYVNDKEKLLRYLTKQELELFLAKIKPNLDKTKPKLERLIKCVLIDNLTDIEKIEKEANIKIDTIRKHVEDTKELEKHLKTEELELFVTKVKKMLKEKDEQQYRGHVKTVKQIINDVLDTRYLYGDICAKNLFSIRSFEKYLYDENFMQNEIPRITCKEVKSKIEENERIRIRCPKDMFIIEEKFCVMIAKKDVHYLNQFDIKRLMLASHYIGTGANLTSVKDAFKITDQQALTSLMSPQLEQILDKKYYDILKHCLNIENILFGNDLNNKKQFMIEVNSFLEQNNFDINLAMLYFKIPEPLFKRVISENINLPYASQETKQMLETIIGSENDKKVK